MGKDVNCFTCRGGVKVLVWVASHSKRRSIQALLKTDKHVNIPPLDTNQRVKKIIKLLKGFLKRLGKEKPAAKSHFQPTIIPRNEHSISRSAINRNALKVLYRLHESGYEAYLVGGCVRDLLFGYRPKDFDIATNALPEEVRRIFKNCRLIGKRFRLAHILFGPEIIEVATFRTHHEKASEQQGRSAAHGMILRDNVYGSLEDDVWRRDFTVNALYYNIADFSVVDYTGGMQDIKNKLLRVIGNPEQRFTEDPVRMLRAVRFVGKCDLQIDSQMEKLLHRLSHLLQNVSPARIFQEVLKLFQEGATQTTFQLLKKYHLFEQLFSETAHLLNQHETQALLDEALASADARVREEKTVSPAFLLAVFLWRPITQHALHLQADKLPPYVALEKAVQIVLLAQVKQLAMPRTLQVTIREICMLQHHFNFRYGSRPYRSLEHPRFRAAYDLLLLRAKAGEPVADIAEWWTAFHLADHAGREKLLKSGNKPMQGRKRSRRSGRKKRLVTNPSEIK